MPSSFPKLALLLIVLCFTSAIVGPPAVQRSWGADLPFVSPNLGQLTRQAGYIFAGTVTKVERIIPSAPNDLATMRITFRVEQAIRGVRTGETLVMREWAGLWDADERYRRGERVVVFLYPPSKLGLTSPVGGALGHFTINSHGEILLENTQMQVVSSSLPSSGRSDRASRLSSQEFLRAIQRESEE